MAASSASLLLQTPSTSSQAKPVGSVDRSSSLMAVLCGESTKARRSSLGFCAGVKESPYST